MLPFKLPKDMLIKSSILSACILKVTIVTKIIDSLKKSS